MGLLTNIFQKKPSAEIAQATSYFKTLTAYTPAFTNWNGKLYESELVRAAIDARARHMSKLKVELRGSAKPKLKTIAKHQPNNFQTWSQFLYRISTILDMQNTAFIVPVINKFGDVAGYYPILPSRCELRETKSGRQVIKYTFKNNETAACYLEEVGIMTKFQYHDDFFGDSNTALSETMKLIDMQNQGIKEGIKNGATYRFMAKFNNFLSDEDLAKERRRFSEENFRADSEAGGILLFPNTYDNIQQIKDSPYKVDADQRKLIQDNVSNYFGVNEDILQNKAFGDKLDAFFDGAIEPFSIQLAEVLTKMTFTLIEQSNGSHVICTANRLMYMPISQKIAMIRDLGDRGYISIDEGREILNLPPIGGEEGAMRPIRGEYYDASDKASNEGDNENE